jgi:hypothetical protein
LVDQGVIDAGQIQINGEAAQPKMPKPWGSKRLTYATSSAMAGLNQAQGINKPTDLRTPY